MPPSPSVRSDTAALRLAGLLESAMDAIITVNAAQDIVLYNRAAERIFGWPASEVMGQRLTRLIPERFRAHHDTHVQRFGETGVSSRRMSGSTVVYGLRANGQEFPVDAAISQLATPEGPLYTVILRDVTDRVRAAQEQANLAARLSGLLESAMDGIITIDAQQRVRMYNKAAENIFGWPAADVIGGPIDRLIPARFHASHAAHVARFGATGVTSRRMGDHTVVQGRRADGQEFPVEASISQLDTPEGKVFTVILRDITERVRSQEELAAYAREASEIREQEKTRIARELHDELAQSLTALKMDTIWVRDHLPAGEADAGARLADMLATLDASVAATRRIAADLRPLLLDDLGLVPAIEWLAQNFQRRTGVACEVSVDPDLELHEPYATAVFRIVQESLANVAKHAAAARVEVAVSLSDQQVLLRVRDDGKGFDASAPRKAHSLGLAGLRERAQLLKGSVQVQSRPGEGTRVEVRIPLGAIGSTA